MADSQEKNKPTNQSKQNANLWSRMLADPYGKSKQIANFIKVKLQMLVGIVLVILIGCNIAYSMGTKHFPLSILEMIAPMPILRIVSYALLVSTALELAYTLFTPQLDEAVEPVISGLAATILLGISEISELKDFSVNNTVGIALLGLILAGLFVIRGNFLKEETENATQMDSHKDNDQIKQTQP